MYTTQHFERVHRQAAKIEVNLPLDGRRRFNGKIVAVEGNDVTIEQDGEPVRIAHANIHKARLVPDFGDDAAKAQQR